MSDIEKKDSLFLRFLRFRGQTPEQLNFDIPLDHHSLSHSGLNIGQYVSTEINGETHCFMRSYAYFLNSRYQLVSPRNSVQTSSLMSEMVGIALLKKQVPSMRHRKIRHKMDDLEAMFADYNGIGIGFEKGNIYVPDSFRTTSIREIIYGAQK